MEKQRWEVLVWGIVNAEEYLYRATNDKSLNCGTGGSEKRRPLLTQKHHILNLA